MKGKEPSQENLQFTRPYEVNTLDGIENANVISPPGVNPVTGQGRTLNRTNNTKIQKL